MAFWSTPDSEKLYRKAQPSELHTTDGSVGGKGDVYTAVAYDDRHPEAQFWALARRADWASDVVVDMARKEWAALDEKNQQSRMKNAVVHWWKGRVGPWKGR